MYKTIYYVNLSGRITHPAMMQRHPNVNEKANFAGAMMITGKNIVNDSSRNNPPAAKKLKKNMSCCPVGMLHERGMHGSTFID